MKNRFFTALALLLSLSFSAQVITVDPPFPTVDDVVTIVYDATEGNGALVGTSPVYAHTGLITSESTTPSDWQLVQGEWGTADASVIMTDLGNDLHQLVIDIDQYYGVPAGVEVLQLAFVFRDATGENVGRAADGGDIFYDMAQEGAALQAALLTPTLDFIATTGDQVEFVASTNIAADISLFDNGELLVSESGVTELNYTLSVTGSGLHEVVLLAENNGQTSSDTVQYVINGALVIENPPAGVECGANHHQNGNVTLSLYAPGKEYVYLIGDFNNWTALPEYFMKRSSDGGTWWLTLDDLDPNSRYAYQYWIDGEGRFADPCSELVLDPWNDGAIDAITYPDPHPYPSGQTSGNATLLDMDQTPFNWQHDDYERPDKTELIIYELHLRDFIGTHNYLTLIDSLDYLDDLGVNAIELMPNLEFEGNNSWGYNPSFHMALDKYYGTPEHFKMFVDECHSRGIAVITDMVLNHVFGQGPHAQMYWDAANNRPAEDNPWLTPTCPSEPFCWGSDYDHESPVVHEYIDRVNTHWIEEYHIDGTRFDFTSGFINGPSGGFNQTRIGLLQRMADVIWSVDPEQYIILEHWADNAEEIQLSNYGMLLWGNVTYNYQEAAMGYTDTNFEWGYYAQRGWNDPHLVTFAESHDEERVTFKTKEYGNSSGDYDTRDNATAISRNEINAVFLLSQPGPKMIWQFGELGYDYSIDYDCRTCPKPILWEYYDYNPRRKLYDVYAAMNALRRDYPTFTSLDIDYDFNGAFKRINLYHPEMAAVVIGNFGVEPVSGLPNFPFTGTWYEYFTGSEIIEENLANEFMLMPGEYRVYTSQPIDQPEITVSLDEIVELDIEMTLYPNPTVDNLTIDFDLEKEAEVEFRLYGIDGKQVGTNEVSVMFAGQQSHTMDVSHLAGGEYQLLIAVDGVATTRSFIVE